MSNRNDDASQGTEPDPKNPRAIPVAEPDNMARSRQIQRDMSAADRAATTPRPPQNIGGKQDWRRG
jgi:hypothetical protein